MGNQSGTLRVRGGLLDLCVDGDGLKNDKGGRVGSLIYVPQGLV